MSDRAARVQRKALRRARARAARELERWSFGSEVADTTTVFFGFGVLELRVSRPFDRSQGDAVRELREAARTLLSDDPLAARARAFAFVAMFLGVRQ